MKIFNRIMFIFYIFACVFELHAGRNIESILFLILSYITVILMEISEIKDKK